MKDKFEPSLMQGDCLEKMKEIPDGIVDMVLTDPPYGITTCKWDSIIPLEPMWEQLKRVIKPNGAIVMTSSQPFTTVLIASNLNLFRYALVWNKKFGSNFANANRMPLKFHEDICVFYKSQPTYNKQMTKREKPLDCRNWKNDKKLSDANLSGIRDQQRTSILYEYKNPTSILEFSSVQGECNNINRVHPTQKPLALMEYLIKTYTNEGETVLDFTMGSGTTGVACKNLTRRFIGIEKDENYFNIATKRILG